MTPDDSLVFTEPPGLFLGDIEKIDVSVSFTWDIPRAEWLAYQWEKIAPVSLGGPAMRTKGGDFEPGKYLKKGYVITSRGCPNKCWFCDVWKRDGNIRELEIKNGWNVLDDNLLACSEKHIRSVFLMLKNQNYQRPEFTGGLEAARLRDWHIDLLHDLKPKQMFFAYDTPDDLEPLIEAGKKLRKAGWTLRGKILRAYVLIGYPKDKISYAQTRLINTLRAGFVPMAMLYRRKNGQTKPDWKSLQKEWARPANIFHKMKGIKCFS